MQASRSLPLSRLARGPIETIQRVRTGEVFIQQPRTRRRHLLSLGIGPEEVHLASRCRRGYWWMSGTGIVQRALDNTWLAEQGVPNLRQQWIELHYGTQNPLADPASVHLTGTV